MDESKTIVAPEDVVLSKGVIAFGESNATHSSAGTEETDPKDLLIKELKEVNENRAKQIVSANATVADL
jgi:hypothetical protein